MSFTIKLVRHPLEVAFEVGKIAEAVSVFEAESSALTNLFDQVDSLGGNGSIPAVTVETTPEQNGTGRRGRRKNQPDPATAAAPAPAPIPGETTLAVTPPTPPAPPVVGDGLQIPAFLDRSNPAAIVNQPPAPPAPPVLPAAPSVVPAAPPPVGVLAQKVIDNLNQRAAGSVDAGKQLADWLAQYQVVVPGATFAEAIEVIRFKSDADLSQIAGALQIG